MPSALVQRHGADANSITNKMADNLCARLHVEAERPGQPAHSTTHVAQIHVVNSFRSASVNSLIGRQAHIAFLEDEGCVRRLVAGLARRFMPPKLPDSPVATDV
jgi:hypothetical protein